MPCSIWEARLAELGGSCAASGPPPAQSVPGTSTSTSGRMAGGSRTATPHDDDVWCAEDAEEDFTLAGGAAPHNALLPRSSTPGAVGHRQPLPPKPGPQAPLPAKAQYIGAPEPARAPGDCKPHAMPPGRTGQALMPMLPLCCPYAEAKYVARAYVDAAACSSSAGSGLGASAVTQALWAAVEAGDMK